MDTDLDSFLASADALRATAHLDGTALTRGESFDGLTVVAPIGRGATCEVWRVHDEANHRDLALKIFCPPTNGNVDALRDRFRAEAHTLASLNHPNIVRTFSLGEVRGIPYFTLELLRPLPEGLSPRNITILGFDLCRALGQLHALGIVHRDLKPDNILVAPDGHYVLADLGIAALTDDKLSDFIRGADNHNPTLVDGHDHALGTPGYAAPEQLSGRRVSPSADIHALGVLFNILLGKRKPLLWRFLIQWMTSSLPTARLANISSVVLALRFIQWHRLTLSVIALIITFCIVRYAIRTRPIVWQELPKVCCTLIDATNPPPKKAILISLPEDAHYHLNEFSAGPVIVGIGKRSEERRRSVIIKGPGTLKCPYIEGAAIRLENNVRLITTQDDSLNTSNVLRPTFSVATGSELTITNRQFFIQSHHGE